jgi:hypothetical protein
MDFYKNRNRNFLERFLDDKNIQTSHLWVKGTQFDKNLYANTSLGVIKLLKNQINDFREYQALDLQNIEWLSPKEKRLCNWVWAIVIKNIKMPVRWGESFDYPLQIVKNNFNTFIFKDFQADASAFTTEERYKAIIDYFDYFDQSMTHKLLYLADIKNSWTQYQRERDSFMHGDYKWLDINDHAQCEWVWDFIRKKYCLLDIKLSPRNSIEMYHDSILTLDFLWPTLKDEYEVSIKELKNAWAQQKIRNKKKEPNLLSPKTEKRLKLSAKKHKLTPSELIDKLLDEVMLKS